MTTSSSFSWAVVGIGQRHTHAAGVEWVFAPHWSVFAEYNFMGFGTQSAAFTACGGSCVLSAKANIQDALVGVNYKF